MTRTGGRARRTIGGVRFFCVFSGKWYSEDRALAIHHTMGGTIHSQWELYRTRKNDKLHKSVCGSLFNDMAELLDCAITMGELSL